MGRQSGGHSADEQAVRDLADALFVSPPTGRIGLEDEPEGANLWEMWGTYRLTSRRPPAGWRLDGSYYYSKLTRGNDAVRTHPA